MQRGRMSRTTGYLSGVAAIALTALLAATVHGAQGTAPAPSADGGAQQMRGKALYTDKCSHCHQDSLKGTGEYPPLIGDTFWLNWETYSANNLVEQIRTTMPADDAGSLPRANYV